MWGCRGCWDVILGVVLCVSGDGDRSIEEWGWWWWEGVTGRKTPSLCLSPTGRPTARLYVGERIGSDEGCWGLRVFVMQFSVWLYTKHQYLMLDHHHTSLPQPSLNFTSTWPSTLLLSKLTTIRWHSPSPSPLLQESDLQQFSSLPSAKSCLPYTPVSPCSRRNRRGNGLWRPRLKTVVVVVKI